jgi:hypothetical protein
MLIIRKEQMEVFRQRAERNFIDSVVKQLRSDHTETVHDVPEDKIYKRVEYGLQRGRGYGLTWQNSLSAFVTLMFDIAPDFDRFPEFHKYLTDESVTANERMGILLRETTEVDWENAQGRSGQAKWPADML